MDKKLHITIAGSAGTGKTSAAVIVRKALVDAGFFSVELLDNGEGDQERKRILFELTPEKLNLKEISVVIEEKQLARCPLLNK